jgi:mono/diheme cytochrome c family protein
MTHVMVRRALFVLVGALLAVALAFGVFVRWTSPAPDVTGGEGPATDTTRGEALYATYCGTCHSVDFSVDYLRAAASVEAGAAALAEFLQHHGSASEAEAAVIIAYLRGRATSVSETAPPPPPTLARSR